MILYKISKQQIDTIIDFHFRLTPRGFENYCARCLNLNGQNILRDKGGFNDNGIDVITYRENFGEKNYVFLQCKKYGITNLVKKDDLLKYYGYISDHKNVEKYKFYFITTGFYNRFAKDFAKEKKLNILDIRYLLKKQNDYPLENFIEQNKNDSNIVEKINYIKQNESSKINKIGYFDIINNILKQLNKIFSSKLNFFKNKTNLELRNNLKEWRKYKAKQHNLPAYYIFSDKTLEDILIKKPRKIDDLFKIYGLGEQKIEKYGNEIIEIINHN